MADLVSLVMEAAATEVLYHEAAQINREVQRLLADVEHATVEERRCGGFAQRLLELLQRRGEIASKSLIIFEEPQSEKISVRAELGSAARYYKPTPQPVASPIQHVAPSKCVGGDLEPQYRVPAPLLPLRIILSEAEAEQDRRKAAGGRGGLRKDDREAVRLFKLSADQGNTFGETNLANLYRAGRGGLGQNNR